MTDTLPFKRTEAATPAAILPTLALITDSGARLVATVLAASLPDTTGKTVFVFVCGLFGSFGVHVVVVTGGDLAGTNLINTL